MSPSSAVIALVRTAVPYVVGWALSLPAAPAVEAALGVSATDARAELTGALVTAAGTAYYAGARWLERRWPAAGWLLGIAARPTYPELAGRSPAALEVSAATGAPIVEHDLE